MEKKSSVTTSIVVIGAKSSSNLDKDLSGHRSGPSSRKGSECEAPRMEKSADSSPMFASRPIKPKSRTELRKPGTTRPMFTTPKMKAKKHNTVAPNLTGFKLDAEEENKNLAPEEFVRRAELKRFTSKSIKKYAFRSQKGIAPENPDKVNQDSLFFSSNFAHFKDYFFMGVCDGHGLNGHHVSAKVKTRLPLHLAADKNLHTKPKQAIKTSFKKTVAEIADSAFDTECSGTTCVSLLIMNKKMYCANVGDSRAVMASLNADQTLKAQALSRDHKPTEDDERTRILGAGGRVKQYEDEYGEAMGPMRVWLSYEDTPGLAMSRSIGDSIAREAGVISEPEILEYEITDRSKMIIIGSDGIWEFISDQEAVDLVTPYFKKDDPVGAVDFLIHIATQRWSEEEEGGTDDITCQVFFMQRIQDELVVADGGTLLFSLKGGDRGRSTKS